MSYPLQFRPNTTADFFNPDGTVIDTGKDMQLFRPLLGCRFNPLLPDFDQHNSPGGIILRFAVQSDAFASTIVGPSNWRQAGLPFFALGEDPLSESWFVTDALPWDGPPTTEKIVSGFASKKVSWLTDPILAPAGGAAYDLTAPELLYGVVYNVTIPAGQKVIYRWYQLLGDAFTVVVLAESIAGATQLVIKGGSPAGANTLATPAPGVLIYSNNPVTLSPSGLVMIWVAFNNTNLGNPLDIDFTLRRGTEVGRDVR